MDRLRKDSVIVVLEPWEYEHACDVGIRRYTANWSKADAAHYDSARMEDNRTAQVAAAICELAVAKHTNRYWHGHVWHHTEHHLYRDMADVGRNIEVRRIRTGPGPAVRTSDLAKPKWVLWGARAIGPEFRQVELVGWLTVQEAWEYGTPSAYAPDTTKIVDAGRMNL